MSKLSLTTSLSNIQNLEAFNISNIKHLFWAILLEFCEPSTEIMQMYKIKWTKSTLGFQNLQQVAHCTNDYTYLNCSL